MSLHLYKLVGRTPVAVEDFRDASFAIEDRKICDTIVGEFLISTVFLVVDHGHSGKGPPVLFETMVFQGEESDVGPWMRRYTSYAEAVEGHNQVVDEVRLANTESMAEVRAALDKLEHSE